MLKTWQKYVNSNKPLPAVFPDIRSQFPDVLMAQDVWNGCTGWATINDYARVRVLEGQPYEKYSPLATWWKARQLYGQEFSDPTYTSKNQGVFEDNALEALIDVGPMLDQYDPETALTDLKANWIIEYQQEPPEDKWLSGEKLKWEQVYQIDCTNPDQKLADTLDALSQGNAVLTSMNIFEAMFSVGTNGIVPDPASTETSNNNHEVCVTTPDMQAQRLWFPNTWGPMWGKHGDGSISFEYFKKYVTRLFVIVPLKVQPTLTPQPAKQYPSDIVDTQWQSSAEWELDNKVMFQYANGLFQPDQPISRGQFAASLMNLYKLFKN